MLKKTFALTVTLTFLTGLAAFADQKSKVGETKTPTTIRVVIPERTVIALRLMDTLKGKEVQVGQDVSFEVTRDVIADNYLAIKKGAPAYGTVAVSEGAKSVSRGGYLQVNVDHCKAVDGTKVPIKAVAACSEDEYVGANIAMSVVICPFILMAKGGEAELTAGTPFKGYVESDTEITVTLENYVTDEQVRQMEQQAIGELKKLEEEQKKLEEEQKKKDEQKNRAKDPLR